MRSFLSVPFVTLLHKIMLIAIAVYAIEEMVSLDVKERHNAHGLHQQIEMGNVVPTVDSTILERARKLLASKSAPQRSWYAVLISPCPFTCPSHQCSEEYPAPDFPISASQIQHDSAGPSLDCSTL
jgi:hypothetical protein